MKIIITALALMLISASVNAEIYKCVDANGKESYSDKKCEHGSSQAEAPIVYTSSWLDKLRDSLPQGSKILSVERKQENLYIKYEFSNKDDVNLVMQNIKRLSGFNVAIYKYQPAYKNKKGMAVFFATENSKITMWPSSKANGGRSLNVNQ